MAKANRLKDIVYNWVTLLATIGPRKKAVTRKLLVIRTDEIGDFMLWHVFLEEIAKAFPGHSLHFIGNKSWKTLFEAFHDNTASQVWWMDKPRFKKDLRYRYGLLRAICRERYSVVVNPCFSRDRRYDDCIVAAAKAAQNWGMTANREAMRPYEYGYDRNLYQHLFDHPERPLFEFYRNRLFTGFVAQTASQVKNTAVDTAKLPPLPIDLPPAYFIVFPGSRSAARIWPAEFFAEVSSHLYRRFGWTAVVCGAPSDSSYASAFLRQYTFPALDLTGKTTLTDMLQLFKTAQCLLSVDTGSIHMAAAVHCRVFGVFNGSQYGRFAPYPKEVSDSVHAIYPEELKAELSDPVMVRDKYEFVIDYPYAAVTPQQVISEIDRTFP